MMHLMNIMRKNLMMIIMRDKYISGNNYLDFRFLNSAETESSWFTILSSDYQHQHTDFEFSCTAATPLGDYWLEGGHFSEFTYDGTSHPAVRDRIRVKVVENVSVDFTRTTAAADIYPFLPVTFESQSEYAESKANAIISGISFTSLDSNTLRYELSKRSTGTGYKGHKGQALNHRSNLSPDIGKHGRIFRVAAA